MTACIERQTRRPPLNPDQPDLFRGSLADARYTGPAAANTGLNGRMILFDAGHPLGGTRLIHPDQVDRGLNRPDLDANGIDDVCEDLDRDGITDVIDNCIHQPSLGGVRGSRYQNGVIIANAPYAGTTVETFHGRCQLSDDSNERFCYDVSNPSQVNQDSDAFGDACDDDIDGDGIGDVCDLCIYQASTSNTDIDNDGRGDSCDLDLDGDGWLNNDDNCPGLANVDQADVNTDGIGDVCQ